MRPVILDGPYRGQKVEVTEGYSFRVAIPEDLPEVSSYFNPDFDPNIVPKPCIKTVTYYIHPFHFGRRCIVTASVDLRRPNEDDAWDLMMTDYAKEAEV